MIIARKLLETETYYTMSIAESFEYGIIIVLIFIIAFSIVCCNNWRLDVLPGGIIVNVGNQRTTPAPPSGLKSKARKLLPSSIYNADVAKDAKECAICLIEFADGDLIRVLPHCGHVLHLVCIDKWLVKHASCPTCRQVVGESSVPDVSQMV